MRSRAFALPVLAVLALSACGSDDGGAGDTGAPDADAASPGAGSCAPDSLETLEAGTLTIATSEPAYSPWVLENDPESGEGFESAVAYAVAEQLGYEQDAVTWTRVDFNAAIQPGPKDFDFDINQFSITDERRNAVDFSSPYYEVSQTVITTGDSPAADATGLADLQDVTLGAQVGTTSLSALEAAIEPTTDPQVFNSNDDAKLALENGQIDALVVDLPTAFFMTSAELEDGVIIGQLPGGGDAEEAFGLVLDLDSPLTECVSGAVDALREDGTLAALETEWLADAADAPVLE